MPRTTPPPSSQLSTAQPSSRAAASHAAASRAATPHVPAPRRQHEHAPHRPERYEVQHRPRRVIRAHETQWPSAEHVEQEDAAPVEARRAPRPSAWKRLRRVGLGPWEWVGLGASCLACVFLLREIAGVEGDHQMLRSQVRQKETQLAALQKQTNEEKKKLAYLQSEKGRDQILAERGYLKPGDRILLFPVEPQADEQSTQ